jgi:hypothetical protein
MHIGIAWFKVMAKVKQGRCREWKSEEKGKQSERAYKTGCFSRGSGACRISSTPPTGVYFRGTLWHTAYYIQNVCTTYHSYYTLEH